jgi:hypothetical protein
VSFFGPCSVGDGGIPVGKRGSGNLFLRTEQVRPMQTRAKSAASQASHCKGKWQCCLKSYWQWGSGCLYRGLAILHVTLLCGGLEVCDLLCWHGLLKIEIALVWCV